MIIWNQVLIKTPVIPRRSAWDHLNADLEYVVGRVALVCVALGAFAGYVSAPSFGY